MNIMCHQPWIRLLWIEIFQHWLLFRAMDFVIIEKKNVYIMSIMNIEN